ncbi:hypothetical protein MY8738_000932 [Beauveria namnaoensis]
MAQPRRNVPPAEPIKALPAAASVIQVPKRGQILPAGDPLSMSQSDISLPFRRSNPSAASLYASTLSPPGSRSMSPSGRASPSKYLASTVFDVSQGRGLPEDAGDSPGEPLSLVLRAFVPHVAIYPSADTEDLIREKGFKNGLWELLRPFGEKIQGKVNVRDSNGVSRVAEDFSIRFTRFGDNIEHPDPAISGQRPSSINEKNVLQSASARDRTILANVEAVVDKHLAFAEHAFQASPNHEPLRRQGLDVETASPYYALYLRRLLSGFPITPHETFAHPVACVVAISSRSESPIEELRRLYAETSQGDQGMPPWVDGEYLRYYVLVHDEENGDITRSMALFEQMKRHLGLHCHLLRLRSSQSAETDDDSIPLPRSDWMTASEELDDIKRSEDDEDFDDPSQYIFESDATAIRTFVKEMVTQSIVPTMERHMSVWNDQVASRRRGITGKFMNLSRKWTGFGSGSRNSSGGANNKDTYDPAGFYHATAAEAIMRKLADFAFMLRDWKLAYSTYDLLRPDFSEAKAWKYYAAANEMAAVSMLMMPQQLTSKTRSETIDQMLESAFYSYQTRCSSPYGALRSLTLGLELLRLRGGSNVDDAGRWGLRLLESRIPGGIGDALTKERLAICYASKTGIGSWNWGSRRRKSAAWSVLAAEAWAEQSKFIPAQRCLTEAQKTYRPSTAQDGVTQFATAMAYVDGLQRELADRLGYPDEAADESALGESRSEIEEESEALTDMRTRRLSIVARGGLETAPLHTEQLDGTVPDAHGQEGFD